MSKNRVIQENYAVQIFAVDNVKLRSVPSCFVTHQNRKLVPNKTPRPSSLPLVKMNLCNTGIQTAFEFSENRSATTSGRASVTKMLQIQLHMIRSIHDNFGQNQVLRRENARYHTHCHTNWLYPEKLNQLYALACGRCPPAIP